MGQQSGKLKLEEDEQLREVLVLMGGDGGIGKTALCVRCLQDQFSVEYDPTLGNSCLPWSCDHDVPTS